MGEHDSAEAGKTICTFFGKLRVDRAGSLPTEKKKKKRRHIASFRSKIRVQSLAKECRKRIVVHAVCDVKAYYKSFWSWTAIVELQNDWWCHFTSHSGGYTTILRKKLTCVSVIGATISEAADIPALPSDKAGINL